MSRPGFGTSLRRDPSQPRDLRARVEAEVAERIAEAVDFVCLDAMVSARRVAGRAAPVAERAEDRAEFDARVTAFLERLRAEIFPGLGEEQRRRAEEALSRGEATVLARLVIVQVALARALPDYWQRFEAVRERYTAESGATSEPLASPEPPASGGAGRSLLRRVFGG